MDKKEQTHVTRLPENGQKPGAAPPPHPNDATPAVPREPASAVPREPASAVPQAPARAEPHTREPASPGRGGEPPHAAARPAGADASSAHELAPHEQASYEDPRPHDELHTDEQVLAAVKEEPGKDARLTMARMLASRAYRFGSANDCAKALVLMLDMLECPKASDSSYARAAALGEEPQLLT